MFDGNLLCARNTPPALAKLCKSTRAGSTISEVSAAHNMPTTTGTTSASTNDPTSGGAERQVNAASARIAASLTPASSFFSKPLRIGTPPAATTSFTCGPPKAETSAINKQPSRWTEGSSSRAIMSHTAGTGWLTRKACMLVTVPQAICRAARAAKTQISGLGCSNKKTSLSSVACFTRGNKRSSSPYLTFASAWRDARRTSSSLDVDRIASEFTKGWTTSLKAALSATGHEQTTRKSSANFRVIGPGCPASCIGIASRTRFAMPLVTNASRKPSEVLAKFTQMPRACSQGRLLEPTSRRPRTSAAPPSRMACASCSPSSFLSNAVNAASVCKAAFCIS
mmetsp:Transcript_98081/g.299842  ORF Transcript_98081/g.299842 Transcript_98081/m.299842 type:complete len:339 (-) Transcript_98081:282-1298(-)